MSIFRPLNRVLWDRFSTLPARVDSGPGKVVKIRAKHFSAVLMGNDGNCVPNSVGKFRVQNQIKRARFLTLPTPMVPRHGKVVKIRLKHFSTVLTGNDKKCTTNCVSMFRVPNVIICIWFSTLARAVVSGLEKVVKIRPKHFLVVLIGRDKNCTSQSVSMFRPLNRVIWDRFSTLPAPVDPGPGKVVKIRSKHVSSLIMGNDRNYFSNSVGKFRVQNKVKRALFLTLPTPMVPRPGKVVKIRPKHFSTVLTGNDKNCITYCVSLFRVPNIVIWTWFSTLVASVVPGLEKIVKIRSKHFLSFW